MPLAIIFSVLASITQLYGYWLYNRGIYTGKIKPNATSWGLWAIGSIIASLSYLELVNDPVKGMLPVACSIVCFGTFVFALFKGKFEKPDSHDVKIILLDVVVVAFWLTTKSPTWTNALMQADVIISFYPIIREVMKYPLDEDAKPWFIWCAAYVLFGLAVIFSWEKWWDLMYPVVYFILHATVGVIAWRGRSAKGQA
jgi:hypothetical protein